MAAGHAHRDGAIGAPVTQDGLGKEAPGTKLKERIAGLMPVPTDDAPEEFNNQYRIEQSIHLVHQLPTLIIGNCLGALVGFLLSVDYLSPWHAAAWLAIPALTVPMILNWLKLRHAPRPQRVSRRRIRVAAYHSGLMGIVWVIVTLFALREAPTLSQLGLIFGLIVLSMGAVASISALPLAAMAYFIPMMTLAFVATTLYGTLPYQPVAVLSGLLYIALIGFLRQNVATFRRNVLMIVEQRRLVEQQAAEVERRTAAEQEMRAAKEAAEQSAQEVQTMHQRLQSIIAALPVPVIIFDQHGGRAIYANRWAADLVGMTIPELLSTKGRDYLPHDSEEAKKVRALKLGQAISDLEMEVKRGDASKIWVRLSCIAMRYEDADAVLVVLEDITDRRMRELALLEAQRAAEEASRTKSAFLANMSHELRTPLNAIIGYSEMLLEDAADRGDESAQTDLENIQVASKHLLRLISDILDLSKIEAGRMQVHLESVDLQKIVKEVCTVVEPGAVKNGSKVSFHCPEDIGSMLTDVTKLKQNLINLMSNAVKFTKDGTISLSVERERRQPGDWIVFRVSDTGIGMSKEQVAKLFQAFVQADSSTTRNYGGTGLGLAITKHFCTLLGGSISVSSKLGKGTTFTMELPDNPSLVAADAAAATGNH
jgi:PAS domain S-box-containing protein